MEKSKLGLLLASYRLSSIIFSPLIDLYLLYRKFRKKEDPVRFKERNGYSCIKRPEGVLYWFHCASVGEANSILPVIEDLLELDKKASILLTTGTVSSASQIENRLPTRCFHQYIVVDKYFAVKRFIDNWQPNVGVFVESEIWPNLINYASKQGCKLILANARMSEKSFRKWQFLLKIGFDVFSYFSLCLPQSRIDEKYYNALGVREVKYLGNIKIDAPALSCDDEKVSVILEQIGSRPIFIAASTHEGEEEKIINASKILQKDHKDLLTIIVPRHIDRSKDIAQLIKSKKVSYAVRSLNDEITDDVKIYLADTLGELGIFYRIAQIAFIGGSFVDIGGHNPIEALKLRCVVITGPYISNFIEVYDDLIKDECAVKVLDIDRLVEKVSILLDDHQKQDTYIENAEKYFANKGQIRQKIVDNILYKN